MNHAHRKTTPAHSFAARLLSALLLVAFAAAGIGSPARAEAVVDFDHYTTELNGLNVAVYCGVDGWGEMVYLYGKINVIFYAIQNEAGGIVYRSKINGMNVTGVGQTTGATYQAVWVGQGFSTLTNQRDGSMVVDIGHLIGRGQNVKSLFKMVFHVGVDANGNETILVDQYITSCRE